MNTFQETIEQLKKYGSEMWIGRICWFSVTEKIDITYHDFHKAILSNFSGITLQPDLPAYPKAADIFSRACTAAQQSNVPSELVSSNKYNYLLRPTGSDTQSIYRTIVRETIDKQGHRLEYHELIRVTFDRKTEKVSFAPCKNNDIVYDLHCGKICEEILSYVQKEANKITVWSVNDCVRRFLIHKLQATMLRKGTYFVNEQHSAALDALDKTLNSLGEGLYFHYLPLLDDSKQREMIRQAFEDESLDQIAELVSEMGIIISSHNTNGDKITAKRFATYQVEYSRLKERLESYTNLLNDKLDGVDSELEIMQMSLTSLLDCVKV